MPTNTRNKKMPPKGFEKPNAKDENGRYKSMSYEAQKESNAAYDLTMDKFIIRLPKGSKAVVEEYVRQMAKENPGNPKFSTDKGRPSVNALIRNLIENEIGKKF